MRLLYRFRVAVRACVRTRRRVVATAILLLLLGWAVWEASKSVRAGIARRAAVAAVTRYDFPAAREHLQLAARLRPNRPETWLLAAQVSRRNGDLAESRSLFARYEKLAGPLTPDGRLERLLLAAQEGDFEGDVYDLLPRVDAGHPASEQILEALATGAVLVYQFDRANFFVHHLLTLFPKNPTGRLIRIRIDDTLGKRERAEEACRELLADFPDNWEAKLLLAGLRYRAQAYLEAVEMYRELSRERPGELRPLLGLVRCRERTGAVSEVRDLMWELEERFPDRHEALLECGRFALTDNRVGDAERLLRRAVELSPGDHEVHYQLGLCLERAGRPDEARRHFERFKEIEADLTRLNDLLKDVVERPRDPVPRREAGIICLRNGQASEGMRWLQGALAIAPNDRATHAALADYFQAQGDLARADSHRQRAR